MRDHKRLGLLFEGADSRRSIQAKCDRVLNLTREQAQDPKIYAQLKEKIKRGEMREVRDHRGFLLLSEASV